MITEQKNYLQIHLLAKQICYASILCIFFTLFCVPESVYAQNVSAYDLINLINGMRSANGLGALSVDSALMACAQSTAETMAASNMTWHIGNVSGRASSFGYNNYNACFATENFTMGSSGMTISEVAASWSDATHMIPATSSSYCHIGAGVAAAGNGLVYYVVQAAYPSGGNGCGYARGTGNSGSNLPNASTGSAAASFILPVITSTPSEDGIVIHTVEEGQTLWAISQAYGISVEDIQSWNKLYNSTALSLGQNLIIPASDQAGKTPTPQAALTVFPTANANGRFYHIVKEGDTLWSISELWNVPLNSIYKANGISADDSIGLGWEIVIPVTATATLPPTETPTATIQPTETETPVAVIETSEEEQVIENKTNTENRILHTPKADLKTYLIMGAILAILTGGGIIIISQFMKKK